MTRLELKKATAPLAQYARGIRKGGPVILTMHGKPVAALLVISNADLETVKLSTSPKFLALIERSRMQYKAEGGISSEEMRRRLGVRPKIRHNGR